MDLSIIVPVYNEEESLKELTISISRVMKDYRFSYEVIMVDDGSTDHSWNVINTIAQKNSNIKGISFRRNYGKSAALQTGFEYAEGDVVITMDADLQDDPGEIPDLYKMIKYDGYDMVSGWKKKRRDPFHKRWPSKFYNRTVRMVSGIKLHDFNCGLKAYRNDVVKSIEVYGEMHRYIPLIAKQAGFKKIGEKIVNHHPRKFGKSKFGMERYAKGYLDLLTISFISRYGRRPMHFFGLIGTTLFLAGFIIAIYLAYQKIAYQAYFMTTRPLFYFGLLAMILGTILFVGGFLGELIIRNSPDRNKYILRKNIKPVENRESASNVQILKSKTEGNKSDSKPDRKKKQHEVMQSNKPEREHTGIKEQVKAKSNKEEKKSAASVNQNKQNEQPQQGQEKKRRRRSGKKQEGVAKADG